MKIIISIILTIGFIAVPICFYLCHFNNGISNEQNIWGYFGDFFGGTIGAFFSVASFILLIITFGNTIEKEDIKDIIETIKIVLNDLKEIINDRTQIANNKEEIKQLIELVKKSTNKIKKIKPKSKLLIYYSIKVKPIINQAEKLDGYLNKAEIDHIVESLTI